MIIERYRDPDAVYARFKSKGRMLPAGLEYISSWVSNDLKTCWQLMETANPALFDNWISKWDDIVDFEIVKVLTSKEAQAATTKRGREPKIKVIKDRE
jgi:hypothetical protein